METAFDTYIKELVETETELATALKALKSVEVERDVLCEENAQLTAQLERVHRALITQRDINKELYRQLDTIRGVTKHES